MLKQGRLTTEMSPTKPVKTCKTPNSMHVLSTPAHFDKSNGMEVPPLNWDESMISNKTIDRSDENKDPKVNDSVKRSRRKHVAIKSRYMQAASAAKTVGKTPRTASAPTPASVQRGSNRQRIEELNREDTFTCEEKPARKPSTPKNTSKNASATTPRAAATTPRASLSNKNSVLKQKPSTPQNRPMIKQSIGGASERKALRAMTDGTPQFTRKTVTNDLFSDSGNEVKVTVGVGSTFARLPRDSGVTESELRLLEHQKLQMLYLLDKMERNQETLRTEATGQIYQMWKTLGNLRNDCHGLEVDCLVKEYLCEVHDMCATLLPICGELSEMLPKFDKQFSTLCTTLDATRHYINTVKIARLSEDEVGELQRSLKQVLDVLRCIYREAAGTDDEQETTLASSAVELRALRECLEETVDHYTNTSTLCREISRVNCENAFLVATKKDPSGGGVAE